MRRHAAQGHTPGWHRVQRYRLVHYRLAVIELVVEWAQWRVFVLVHEGRRQEGRGRREGRVRLDLEQRLFLIVVLVFVVVAFGFLRVLRRVRLGVKLPGHLTKFAHYST